MGIQKGDLVRWVVDWGIFTVSADGEAHGAYPEYCYGLVVEVSSTDANAVVVHCFNRDNEWRILHMIHDEFEIISRGEIDEQG